MSCSRTVESFEPILIEERGERGLAELRLPEDSEQRGGRLIIVARRRQQNSRALRRLAIECAGTRSEPELDESSPLGRRQREMGDLVQDYVSLRSAVQCRSVPIEAAWDPLRVDRHAEAARE
jgi:hypothetical protein